LFSSCRLVLISNYRKVFGSLYWVPILWEEVLELIWNTNPRQAYNKLINSQHRIIIQYKLTKHIHTQYINKSKHTKYIDYLVWDQKNQKCWTQTFRYSCWNATNKNLLSFKVISLRCTLCNSPLDFNLIWTNKSTIKTK
jgi:hypothetical protein